MSTRPRERGPLTAILFVIAAVVSACAGPDPSPTPVTDVISSPPPRASAPANSSPTPRPSVQPSPKIDVVAAFQKEMASLGQLDGTVAGTMTAGAVDVSVMGTLQSRGSDSHQLFTITGAGKTQTTETISIGGTTYTRRGEVWFAAPKKVDPSAADMSAAIARSVAELTDLGPTTKDGRMLNRLAPPAGTTIPMAAFGGASPGSSNAELTIEFYAEPDGTPAIIALDGTWTQDVGATDQPASMHLDFTLADHASIAAIQAPSPIWVTKASKRLAYTMSYPSGWDVEPARKTSGADYYYGLDGEGVIVTRTTKCRCTLNATTNEVIRYERRHAKGFKVARNTTMRLGGQRARRLESHGTYDGHRSWDLTYLVVRGKYLFIFDYGSDAPLTATDRATADQMMQSVVFR
jgi:DcrB-like protein